MSFFHNVGAVGAQVLILFLMMGFGFFAAKMRWINETGSHQMTAVLLNLVTPCIIIQSFLTLEHSPDTIANLGLAVGFSAAAHLIGFGIGWLAFRRGDPQKRSLYRFAVPFTNCGFIGIPVTRAVLGDKYVVWVTIFIAVFHFFTWTVGIRFFDKGGKPSLKKAVINPGVIGIVIGLALYLFKVTGDNLPNILHAPIKYMYDINTPLAMIITGYFLATVSLLPRKGDGAMWAAILLRLLAIPAIMLGAAWALGLRNEVTLALMVPIAAPISTMAILFPTQLGGDVELGARMTPWSNIASALTMPLIIALSQVVLR